MKTSEKHIILNALVSSIRYCADQSIVYGTNSIDNNYVKDTKKLFLKLNEQYFKNNEKSRNGYVEYLEEILQEINTKIEKERGI